MRMITRNFSSGLFLVLLTALPLIAASGQAYAQTRSFQMSLWAESDEAPGVDTDIPAFYDGQAQPAGRSILIRFDMNKQFSVTEYAWWRIDAVLFDEPYNDFNGLQGPCWSQTAVANVNARVQLLAQRAAELKAVAPLTRFWVNLAKPQLDWVMGRTCSLQELAPVDVNQPYIDVISVDIYRAWFNPDVKRYYDWLETHRAKPDQQLALIPGTHYEVGEDIPALQALILQEYFDFANEANQNCDLPLGSRGVTGSFDGCRVWIVLGWLAQNYTVNGTTYKGVRDPSSWQIADVWQSQLALPVRPDLAHRAGPAELLPSMLFPLL